MIPQYCIAHRYCQRSYMWLVTLRSSLHTSQGADQAGAYTGFFSMKRLKPGSDAVLHMSRIELNELSSCEVRRLNQFGTANIIRIGLSRSSRLTHPGITAVDRL